MGTSQQIQYSHQRKSLRITQQKNVRQFHQKQVRCHHGRLLLVEYQKITFQSQT